MATVTFPRIDFTKVSYGMVEMRQKLAVKASKVLSYSQLERTIGSGTLLGKLKELDIAPFSTSAVHAYMNSKVWRGIRPSTKHSLSYLLVAIASLVGIFVNGHAAKVNLTALQYENWPFYPYLLVNLLLVISGIGFTAASVIWAASSELQRPRRVREWVQYSLDGYSGAVPEFALEHAVRIKEALPDAAFKVVQLTYREDQREAERALMARIERERRLQDPFLLVEYGSESFYIDVWDEKEFEQII